MRELGRDSTSLHLAVDAAGPVHLLLHTAAFPGWQLEVDGKPRPLVGSSPEDLVAVDLDGGSHELWLRFGPTPLRTASAALSALSVLLLLAGGHAAGAASRAVRHARGPNRLVASMMQVVISLPPP